MKCGVFELRDRVRDLRTQVVHVVAYATNAGFDAHCGGVVDNYQPAYLRERYPDQYDAVASQVEKANDDAITCLACLVCLVCLVIVAAEAARNTREDD